MFLVVKHFLVFAVFQAAARHQCSYLVNLHVNDFLQVGGDPKWLNGLDGAPQKLRALGELNKILAHRPWLLTKTHIEVLCMRLWRCMSGSNQIKPQSSVA